MRILLLSRYDRLGASSRLRSFQYIPYLESKGWQVEVSPLFSDHYVQNLYGGSSLFVEVIKGYWQRLRALITVKQYDLIWIEKEIFPFMPASAEWLLNKLGIVYLVDYDDALFHRYDKHRNVFVRMILGNKIDTVMNNAKLVVVGNDYLVQRALNAGSKRVEFIPTVIDLGRYTVLEKKKLDQLVIGWIGSPSTTRYLTILLPVFFTLKQKFNLRIIAVGADEDALKNTNIEVIPWSELSEVNLIQQFDIGIMPLDDSPWEQGKCGYKLIQYMACGLPVVASPIGVNRVIVEHGHNGFLADDLSEWESFLSQLLSNPYLRNAMGENGRAIVEEVYCLQVQASKVEVLMQSVIDN